MADHLDTRDDPAEHTDPYDKNEPRSNLIAVVAIASALTLAGLIPVFNSYFNTMTDAELEEKVWAPGAEGSMDGAEGVVEYVMERNQLRGEQEQAIEGKVADAMELFATRGRQMPRVRPVANDRMNSELPAALATLDAVGGWAGMPNEEAKTRATEALQERRAREEEAAAAEAAALEAAALLEAGSGE